MMTVNNKILDNDFLNSLSEQKKREFYARITALDINEIPLEQIEGKITGGSINIDGDSSIRRTCSLTLVNENININDYYWGIKTKFKLELGLRNQLTGKYAPGQYPEIVWFPQGIYVISTFNTSYSTSGCTISISGKDKMCLLNGDLGGQLFASIDFGTEEEETQVMEPVKLGLINNSNQLMNKKYYIKIENPSMEVLYNNNLNYIFIQNQESGNYYKDGNVYKLIHEDRKEQIKYYDAYKIPDSPNDLFERIIFSNNDSYKPNTYYYKKNNNKYILDTSKKINLNRQYYYKQTIGNNYVQIQYMYIPNKYYYKENDLFLLDSSLTTTQERDYYIAPSEESYIDTKVWDYEPDTYYYYQDNQYYVLDASENQEQDREYYKLKTLYQHCENIVKKKLTIENIVREAIHTYANEPYHNIIIKDLDNYGLEQLTYKGDEPLYVLNSSTDEDTSTSILLFKNYNKNFENIIDSARVEFNPLSELLLDTGDKIIVQDGQPIGVETKNGILKYYRIEALPQLQIPQNKEKYIAYLELPSETPSIEDNDYYNYSIYISDSNNSISIKIPIFDRSNITENNKIVKERYNEKILQIFIESSTVSKDKYTIAEINYGDDIGYRLTDLTYSGDLITSLGENLTSMLDKIKQMLSDFEYFYDENGRFIFQKKKTYVNTSWSQLTQAEDEQYINFANDESKIAFNFEGNRLISSISNSPVINNLKNDFIVWGKRKGISGSNEIPIHGRYAIDKKPHYYKAFNGKVYITNEKYLTDEDIQDFKENISSIKGFLHKVLHFSKIYESNIAFLNNKYNNAFKLPEQEKDISKNNCGTFGPGWWDIRDWARYYRLLKDLDINDGKYPNGTMKFYSTDGESGFVPRKSILGNNASGDTWFIEIEPNSSLNFSYSFEDHELTDSSYITSEYYESNKINGNIETFKIENVTKPFENPRKNDDDQHTYLYYLNKIEKDPKVETYIFYNPSFPFGETAEQLINNRIKKEYLEYYKDKNIFIVDWREIIYQMALDYFASQDCSDNNPVLIKDSIDSAFLQLETSLSQEQIENLIKSVYSVQPEYILYNSNYSIEDFVKWYKINANCTCRKTYIEEDSTYKYSFYRDGAKQCDFVWIKDNNANKIFQIQEHSLEKRLFPLEKFFVKPEQDILVEDIFKYLTTPDNFLYEVAERNKAYYPTGYTGYEQYYTDMQGFWRKIYNPDYIPQEIYTDGEYDNNNIWQSPKLDDYNLEYYIGLNNEQIKIQYEKLQSLINNESDNERYEELYKLKQKYDKYLIDFQDNNSIDRLYWNVNVFEQPELLDFWIEFLDSDQELAQFAVPQIGDRTKVVNDDKANVIVYKSVPNIILYENADEQKKINDEIINQEISIKTGYNFINVPKGMSQYFTISYRTHSVKDKIDELLYQYSYCIENVSISALPIYHLKPNTLVYIRDEDIGINGEYIINKITYSLVYNGLMSITAIKNPQRII